MKLAKALKELGMARSGTEAQRLVKSGAVLVGGCLPPCNGRLPPFKCTCEGWERITNPTKDITSGAVLRIGDGNWRLLKSEGSPKFDQVPGIGWVPKEVVV